VCHRLGKGGEKWEGTKKGGHKTTLIIFFPTEIIGKKIPLTEIIC
jgi:hypothetical protein